MKLDAYNKKDIQNFLAILNQCETEGVTDTRIVREKLHNHLNRQFRQERIEKSQHKRRIKSLDVCPSCGVGYLMPVTAIEGLNRVGCARCRYSRVVL